MRTLTPIDDQPTNTTALVFDYGERRVGAAYANRLSGSAEALKTLITTDPTSFDAELAKLIREWSPDTIVIGVPYNDDGTESDLAKKAIEFGARLAQQFGLPVEQVDERLTSMEARQILNEQRRSGQRRRKIRREDIDSLAARLIAESWLRDS